MASDRHSRLLVNARRNQIPDRRTAEVMHETARKARLLARRPPGVPVVANHRAVPLEEDPRHDAAGFFSQHELLRVRAQIAAQRTDRRVIGNRQVIPVAVDDLLSGTARLPEVWSGARHRNRVDEKEASAQLLVRLR